MRPGSRIRKTGGAYCFSVRRGSAFFLYITATGVAVLTPAERRHTRHTSSPLAVITAAVIFSFPSAAATVRITSSSVIVSSVVASSATAAGIVIPAVSFTAAGISAAQCK